jgi:hypothetical protein
MNNVKYFLCPMSKNIVDAVLQLGRKDIGLLPSRRQIDYNGGYVGWNTEQFANYVKGRILIERDHGGAGQGAIEDDGRNSYMFDSKCFNLVHVDPWKTCSTKEQGLEKTIADIEYLHSLNNKCRFEVGTEQSIFPLSTNDLFWFMTELQKHLSVEIFSRIEYIVIQSGVKLDVINEKNIGCFNQQKLVDDIDVCQYFSKKSKEHNGDFLSSQEKNLRFQCGLTSINIGPELSIFENKVYLNHFTKDQIKEANEICYTSGLWKKWVTPEHDLSEEGIYFKICGHYNYHKISLPDVNATEKLKEKILTMIQL